MRKATKTTPWGKTRSGVTPGGRSYKADRIGNGGKVTTVEGKTGHGKSVNDWNGDKRGKTSFVKITNPIERRVEGSEKSMIRVNSRGSEDIRQIKKGPRKKK